MFACIQNNSVGKANLVLKDPSWEVEQELGTEFEWNNVVKIQHQYYITQSQMTLCLNLEFESNNVVHIQHRYYMTQSQMTLFKIGLDPKTTGSLSTEPVAASLSPVCLFISVRPRLAFMSSVILRWHIVTPYFTEIQQK